MSHFPPLGSVLWQWAHWLLSNNDTPEMTPWVCEFLPRAEDFTQTSSDVPLHPCGHHQQGPCTAQQVPSKPHSLCHRPQCSTSLATTPLSLQGPHCSSSILGPFCHHCPSPNHLDSLPLRLPYFSFLQSIFPTRYHQFSVCVYLSVSSSLVAETGLPPWVLRTVSPQQALLNKGCMSVLPPFVPTDFPACLPSKIIAPSGLPRPAFPGQQTPLPLGAPLCPHACSISDQFSRFPVGVTAIA